MWYMKLQLALDIADLDKALKVADEVEKFADIIEIGTVLIYKYGDDAIKRFKEKFPHKTILADAKIADLSKDAVEIFAHAGADWITVLGGVNKNVIHNACITAHELGKKIMVDLIDAHSPGQLALEAKSLGADALLFHRANTEDSQNIFAEQWEMVKGNTPLPIFITANINKENVAELLSIGASGIILGKNITNAQHPEEEIAYFSNIIGKKE